MVSFIRSQEVLKEMNAAFAHLPQGVIWKYNPSRWPKDIKLAPNVKIVHWLPQNDLLGKDCPGLLFSSHLHVLGIIGLLISSWIISSAQGKSFDDRNGAASWSPWGIRL